MKQHRKEYQDLDEGHHSNIFNDDGSSLPQDEFNYGAGSRSEEEIIDFDQVVGKLDPLGKYQRMLLYWVISPICAVQSIVSYNSIFMLFSPEHWCAGPGRQKYDDVEEYKLINIPMHNTSNDLWKYSSCSVHGANGTESRCEWGWEFDKTDYEKTMTSEYEWVCDNGSIPPNALLMSVIGNALGILGCGFLSDNWGRKPAAFLAIFINTLFRFLSLFTGSNWLLFYVCQFIVGLAQTNIYVVPTLISAELSTKDARAEVYAVTWTASLVGLCALPTISWLCGDWFLIGLVTAATGACTLMSFSLIPESPRWLLRKGRLEECVQVLEKIQAYNKTRRQSQYYSYTELQSMLEKVLSATHNQQQSEDGGTITKSEKATFSVLFTKFNLARNTLLLTVCWSVNTLIYGVMTFNATHMSGSHFTSFFLLGIIELPSGYIGGYLADTVGRRWTQTFAFVFSAVSCFGTSLFVHQRELEIGLALFTKLVATISFLVVYLQAAEFFPTELRSRGCGIASTTANMVTISAPVIAQMSTSNPAFPWIFNGLLSILGVIAASQLPETLNVPLPETVEEANNIGRRTKTHRPTSSVDIVHT